MKRLTSFLRAMLILVLGLGLVLASTAEEALCNPLRIMLIGDSITHGGQEENAYRKALYLALKGPPRDCNVDFIGTRQHGDVDFDRDHDGYSGWRADQILDDSLIWDNAATGPPDIALIHLGTNDIGSAHPTYISCVDSTINDLSQIIDKLRDINPNVIVLLAQIIPSTILPNKELIPELNFNSEYGIPFLAASKSTTASPVIIVDQYTGFDASLSTYDGVHPNDIGDQKMADKWIATLDTILPGLCTELCVNGICQWSMWSDTTIPTNESSGDPHSVEVGVKFQTDVDGYITALRFYKSSANTGTHVGNLWTVAGTLLASVTFSGESPSGWQEQLLSSPVPVTANTTYIASYFTPTGNYAYDINYFLSSGEDYPPLRFLSDGEDGPNGVYAYSFASTFPISSSNSTNYWVDVVFSTSATDEQPPIIVSRFPLPNATGVTVNTSVTATFNEPVQEGTISFELRDSSDVLVPATVTYDGSSNTATLVPNDILADSSDYTAIVSEAIDLAGNPMAAPDSWSFTTADPIDPGAQWSIWSDTTIPTNESSGDPQSVELGVKFQTDVDGYITALRFYKSSANTGTHVGNLWTVAGTLLASVTFSGESPSGWQEQLLSSPVPVTANTTYIASYFTPTGNYAYDSNYFLSSGEDNPPLRFLSDGEDGPNGVYAYSSVSTFPTSSYSSTNYWVDVVFSTSATDEQPPIIVSRFPLPNATGVTVNTSVTATFNEPVQEGTISFELRDSSDVLVPATVTYDGSSNTATLVPNDTLADSSDYTAIVSEAIDLAGNPMAAQDSWSFTTADAVTIDWNDQHQQIDGFGASSAWETPDISDTLADLFFSVEKGIGLSLLRNRIAPDGTTLELVTMEKAQTRGAKIWSTPWSPPAEWKTNNDVNNGGHLISSYYQDYANRLAEYVEDMEDEGINLYAISVQNEPDWIASWETCLWSEDELHSFVPYLYSALATRGLTSTKIMIAEQAGWDFDITSSTMNDPNTASMVGILAAHNYDRGSPSPINTFGKQLWQTEVSSFESFDGSIDNALIWATNIHEFMTIAEANAWHYWALIWGDNNGLLDIHGNPAKRMWAIGNFSKFIRPGYYRIGASDPGDILVSAYKDPDTSKVVVVVVNNNDVSIETTFNLINFNPGNQSLMIPWITSGSVSLEKQQSIEISANSFTYTLPAFSVVTFVEDAVWYVDGTAPPSGDGKSWGTAFNTINEAISAARAGDKVNVAAGIYRERLVIEKQLTFTGAGPDVTIVQPTDAPTAGVYDVEIDAGGTIIQGFQFDFNGADDTRSGEGIVVSDLNDPPVTNVKILNNNIYTGDGKTGIQTGKYSDVSGLIISGNIFYGDSDGMGEGVYINPFTGSGDVIIQNNEFYGFLYSGVSIEASNVQVTDNVIDSDVAKGVSGIRFIDLPPGGETYGNVLISGNDISNLQYGISIGTSTDVGSTLTATIVSNILSGNDVGLRTRYGATPTIWNNSISGNSVYGLSHEGAGIIVAENNWWGDLSGPSGTGAGTGDPVSANVDYDPWLTSLVPVADFSATPTSGLFPLNVTFTDLSTGVNSWSWDFGDGNTSTVQSPSHTYSTPGTYTVILTVTGPGGSHTEVKVGYIAVTDPGTQWSIWSDTTIPTNESSGDMQSVEVGVKFQTDVDGYITALRFYKSIANTGTHVGNLWTVAGTLLASVTFSGESPSGWQEQLLSSPVPVTANTTYIASYFTPTGNYAYDSNYFLSSGEDNPPLRFLSDGEDGPNGVYAYSSVSTFPFSSYRSANYWVDVVFSTSATDEQPPIIVSRFPLLNATGVTVNTSVAATFNEPVQEGTISFELRDSSDVLVPATVTYDGSSNTATLVPNDILADSVDYTAIVSEAIDLAGNPMAAPDSWSFTTADPIDPGAQWSIWSDTTIPTNESSGDPQSVEVGVKFQTDVDGYITALRFYKSSANTGTHVGNLWTVDGTLLASATFSGESPSGWQEQLLSSPVPVTANTTYIASYFTPTGNYAYDTNYFLSSGEDNPPLRFLSDGEDGPNGVYAYSSVSTFPTSSYRSANYWVDVVFSTSN